MRHLILHIGQEKTGTTTLQATLAASREALLAHDVLYIPSVRTGNQRGIIPHFLGCDAMFPRRDVQLGRNAADYLRNSKAEWDALCAAVARHPSRTIVISAEQLFVVSRFPGFPEMLTALCGLADRVTVVAYLRDPAPHFLSLVQEVLKDHGNLPTGIGNRNRDQLTPFLAQEGVAVAVHRFAPETLIAGDIVTDFVTRHLPDVPLSALVRPERDINTSLSAEAMAVLQAIHDDRFPPGHSDLRKMGRRVISWVREIDPQLPGFRRPALRPGMAQRLYALSTDHDWLAAHFGITFPPPPADHAAAADAANVSGALGPPHAVSDLCLVDPARADVIWEALAVRAKAERAPRAVLKRAAQRAVRNYAALWAAITRPLRRGRRP